jgi:hypothetical protein
MRDERASIRQLFTDSELRAMDVAGVTVEQVAGALAFIILSPTVERILCKRAMEGHFLASPPVKVNRLMGIEVRVNEYMPANAAAFCDRNGNVLGVITNIAG